MRAVHAPKEGVVIVCTRSEAKAIRVALAHYANLSLDQVNVNDLDSYAEAKAFWRGLDNGILL